MDILIIGNGGREHALGWKLGQSPLVDKIHISPPEGADKEKSFVAGPEDPDNIRELINYLQENQIELVVIGPEVPLVNGLADKLRAANILVFGPGAEAARLEGSKLFAKNFMQKQQIPTGNFAVCNNMEEVKSTLKKNPEFLVVKADGLAGGKGVGVFDKPGEVVEFSQSMFSGRFGNAGKKILLEEKLEGPELSVFLITDGKNYKMFSPSRDHKRLLDKNRGPNTGGMGAYTPINDLTEKQMDVIESEILKPVVSGLAKEGIDYNGLLYVGLIMTSTGPKVLEFNCRFGDPETQPLMVHLDCDLLPWIFGVAKGKLPVNRELQFKDGTSLTVVMASKGYPFSPEKGYLIEGLDEVKLIDNVKVFFAGCTDENSQWITSGGRVLGVTAWGINFEQAFQTAYEAVDKIKWPGVQYRKDIGKNIIDFNTTERKL
ncbi:MAG: phosphoribosylamine--glycine ligase [Deltaproteobacteria bacterium]|jgi:phosphoribosylamine--glycine ligase|nr:phosphoribosylamine--glycine ligase [Deltaproteobacteria bacterium]